MGRNANLLNEKQLAVLHWVDRGCPDGKYVDDNYGHRVTAKALASGGDPALTVDHASHKGDRVHLPSASR